ncbi:MAG: sigma-54-dependent Fis family transcriptional regulator [Magnetococcales bacterium]|nr:sigma-54-dependent Fis family transcriptional regulator [Magnetococcales bacterium]
MHDPVRILVVDRDKVAAQNMKHVLVKDGCQVTTLFGGAVAVKHLDAGANDLCQFEVILADLGLDSVKEGIFLRHCQRLQPATELIFISDKIAINSVVDAIRQGAFHYLSKPVRPNELRQAVMRAAENSRHKQRQRGIRRQLAEQKEHRFPLITSNLDMLRLLEQAGRVAALDLPVLITGETGTGKELLARFLHDASNRTNKPFVAVNCGAFNEELLANELFGHGREAFTGAVRDRKGLVETAHGGTLFLDEITEMSLNMQVKLLRVLQEKEVQRLGDTTPVRVDVRILAATNHLIQEEVEAGRFRKDLYYRINVINLYLPPLFKREGDIPVLVQYFLEKHAESINRQVTGISRSAMECLTNYSFPGNVRELENIIQHGMAFSNGPDVTEQDLPESVRQRKIAPVLQREDDRLLSLEEMEAKYIQWVCKEVKGNQTMAAKVLGLDRVSLWRRLKKMHSHTDSAVSEGSEEIGS